jgi:His/Glu/Gln/Arg/opine family amino acid ABC transporter permease subunit
MSLIELIQRMTPGAITTIELTLVVFPISVVAATVIALIRVYRIPVLAQLAAAFVEIVRSTPLLLLLFFAYFALPFLGIYLDSLPTAIAGLSINFAAYMAEIIRAGILSVPVGYVDAGRVLGMDRRLMMVRVLAPLAFRVVLPPMANSLIELFKATAVVSLVAVHEIAFIGSDLSVRTFQSVEIYILVSLFYIGVGYPSTRLMRWLERKVRLPETFAAA